MVANLPNQTTPSNPHRQRKLLGYLYLAKRPCGKVVAMCWDDPGEEKDTAKHVASYIRRGYSVERMARYDSDPIPEWACQDGCECPATEMPTVA